MRFWDSSALIPLLLVQDATAEVKPLAVADPQIVAWWGTSLECASAAARLRREGVITIEDEEQVLSLVDTLRAAWTEVTPSDRVLGGARRLLRIHALRAADALQLSAALLWADGLEGSVLVTLDERLALAARLEGLTILP